MMNEIALTFILGVITGIELVCSIILSVLIYNIIKQR